MDVTKQLTLPVIPKDRLEDGAYYFGKCRNANIARWNAARGKFTHWRTKWGSTFTEEICCQEDEAHFDVFFPLQKVELKEIPFEIPLEAPAEKQQ
jgi:hypothetical protein